MERTTTNNGTQLQALNDAGGWIVREGDLTAWPEGQVSGWRNFWPGIPTRVFHLLAAAGAAAAHRSVCTA